MNVRSQCQAIERHLRSGRAITALEALQKFGCFRLAARIFDLKDRGLPIRKQMVKRGEAKVASYFLGTTAH
jgi:hypothetical protein